MSPEVKRGPFSPREAAEFQAEQQPDEVFVVFNALIARSLRNGKARVLQRDAVAQLIAGGMDRAEIFDQKLLDVEESYRTAGWKVEYDKPVYYGGENFEPYFEFSAPKGELKLVQEYH
jgi:hypothetical protein